MQLRNFDAFILESMLVISFVFTLDCFMESNRFLNYLTLISAALGFGEGNIFLKDVISVVSILLLEKVNINESHFTVLKPFCVAWLFYKGDK